ncbi:hypothetical protein GcC1_012016 [Golovinomyces cichoracearum]|uniref:SUN domain-containing protein n=1 Tax=Golovinomyces cichoracearum TaxID=62708 RepID=A0A420J756_9PEZI|nr:hypothetical protein GcC1_012016 [Golovinomyces cichoracearum]
MTTRRATRAGSRAVTSHEESPAISTVDLSKTPVRGPKRRLVNTPLPPVHLKSSTAYGTNNNAQSLRTNEPKSEKNMTLMLNDILDPKANKVNSIHQSPCFSKPPPLKSLGSHETLAERSFDMESDIFRGASLESSVIHLEESSSTSFNDRSSSQCPSDQISSCEDDDPKEENPTLLSNDWNYGKTSPLINLSSTRSKTISPRVISKFRLCPLHLKKILFAGVALFLLFLFSKLLTSNMHSVRRYFSDSISNILSENEVSVIHNRLSRLESDVSGILLQVRSVDFKAIKRLEEILPDSLAIKKKDGKLQISKEFWEALLDKIRVENNITISSPTEKSKYFEDGLAPYDQVDHLWEKFLTENQRKIEQLLDENLTHRFPQLLLQNEIITKFEIIELIRENWEQNSAQINIELRKIAAELKQKIPSHKIPSSSMSNEELKKITAQYTKYPQNTYLQAVAQVSLLNSIYQHSMKLNHFSKKTGAQIEHKITSPNYVLPSQAGMRFYERFLRHLSRNYPPPPNPPEEALSKWDEHGDCWCSPAKYGGGFGLSLGVILGNKIYPEEIVIEHIQSSAALQPGAAPRMLELFAAIEDPEIEPFVRQESQRLFPNLNSNEINGLKSFVCIASWTYDLESSHNVQAHEIQLSLRGFGIGTSRVLVRSISNWGTGDVNYTCLYRVRLHGALVKPQF